MNRAIPCLCALTAPFALAACAGGGNYPSLAIRDVERVSGTAQAVAPEAEPSPAPPLSEDLDQRIARLISQARQAHTRFENRAGSASAAVGAARGARSPSDSWVQAHVALADLQALRSDAVIALADVDELFAEERNAFPGNLSPTAEALSQTRDQIGAWVEEEDQIIAQLASRLAN